MPSHDGHPLLVSWVFLKTLSQNSLTLNFSWWFQSMAPSSWHCCSWWFNFSLSLHAPVLSCDRKGIKEFLPAAQRVKLYYQHCWYWVTITKLHQLAASHHHVFIGLEYILNSSEGVKKTLDHSRLVFCAQLFSRMKTVQCYENSQFLFGAWR